MNNQIIVCDNHIMERESFESTITHELVRLYYVYLQINKIITSSIMF